MIRPKISVIVPVYNVAPYLRECLDSLVRQTLRDIEIIVVNDGSTDTSALIINEYARADSRIKVIQQPYNQSQYIARLDGFRAATGEFIGCVDGDDWVLPETFESAHRTAMTEHADMVIFSGRCFYEAGTAHHPRLERYITQTDEIFTSGAHYLKCKFTASMCLSIYHRRLWELALPWFPRERLVYEDNFTAFILSHEARRVVSLSQPFYQYRQRPAAATSSPVSWHWFWTQLHSRTRIICLLDRFLRAQPRGARRRWIRLSMGLFYHIFRQVLFGK